MKEKKGIKKLSISLVIPTFNDERVVEKQILACERILKQFCEEFEIIVSDDASYDTTPQILTRIASNNHNIRVANNNLNIGITANVRKLYKLAKKEFIMFYSADGDWDPRDLRKIIITQIENEADIVIGKRGKKIGYTLYRHFVSYLHRFLPLIMFGVDTKDPGGIKLIRRKFAQIKLISKSQLFEAEIIIRAKKSGAKLCWCVVKYKKPSIGAGLGGSLNSAFASFIDLIRLRFLIP